MTTLEQGAAAPGGAGVGAEHSLTEHRRHAWLSANCVTAFVLAALLYIAGREIGDVIYNSNPQVTASGQNNVAQFLAFGMGFVGWIIGIGALNYPITRILGLQPAEHAPSEGWTRYFRMTTDHKVVGIQYLFAVLGFFFTAGLFAMAFRAELLDPIGSAHLIAPDIYLQIVSQHGTMMMMMASSMVVGPLGNYLIPIMIGARRMAFPRIEAFSLWMFVAGYITILIALPLGGFDTGWTGYAPLQTQDKPGIDAYLVGFCIIGLGMIFNGLNQVVTIVNLRAPGMRWTRLPIFVWSMLATGMLLILATPVLFMACFFGILDRSWQTAFYVPIHGGSNWLWENLFWFFGHPEVYIMAVPAFGLVAEMLPVFCRKPLFAYRLGAAGMLGVALLSFFVWQHHLFMSGMNPDMRPVFMLTTELISIPTGFIYLIGFGTLWRARMRFEVPMLFCLAFFFNFLIGGITGVYQSDVPVDTTVHGSFFVLAHFHYTIMGGLVFVFFGAVYYFFPRMTGRMLNKTLGKVHFWWMFIAFNFTFFPMFIVGLEDQPRRVFEYAPRLQTLNDWSTACAWALGASFLPFIWNLIRSYWIDPVQAPVNPWQSRGIEWMLPYDLPWYNFERLPIILSDPYRYGEPDAPPVADLQGELSAADAPGQLLIEPTGELRRQPGHHGGNP